MSEEFDYAISKIEYLEDEVKALRIQLERALKIISDGFYDYGEILDGKRICHPFHTMSYDLKSD